MNRPPGSSAFPLRIRSVVALVLVASASLWAPMASSAAADVGTLQLITPVTDNYKTWQEDRVEGHTDNRTSLLFTGIVANGQTYVVPQNVREAYGSPVGAPTEWDAQGGIPLATSVDGPVEARLTFNHDGANAWSYFRLWPDGVFGPLMTINRPEFVTGNNPVPGTFEVKSTAGAVLASRTMSYRYDAGIAALPVSSVEWRGPLGRWHLGSDATAPTPLNWPAGTAVSETPAGPHDAQIALPPGQASMLYVAPVDIAGLAVPRVPEAISLAWSPAGAGRPSSAAGVQAWRPISVTVPAGTYGLDVTGTCQSACRFDHQSQALTAASSQVVASSAPTYRPDAKIRAEGGAWTGAGAFFPDVQSLSSSIPLGSSRVFDVRVTNDGTTADTFGLADARSGTHAAFLYTWRYQGVDVTSQVHDEGWFVLPDVPVGATRTLQLTVTAKPDAAIGVTAKYALHAYHSPASAGIKDVVGLALSTTSPSPGGGYVRPPGVPEVPIQACSRYAAPNGSDANPGTAASPVLTLNRLTSVLQPGQTGCLKDDSEIVLPATGGTGIMLGGTAGQPKIIRPETPGSRAAVRGRGKFLIAADQSDLILKDIDIRGADDVGGGNLFHVNGDRVTLDGVDISWPRNICLGVGAASGQFAEDFVLIDSRIHDCGTTHVNDPADPGGAHGAYLQYVRDGATDADSWGAIVYNTLFDHNDARGLQLYPDADSVLVDRTVLYGNGSNLNIGADSTTVRSEANRVRNTIIANSRLNFDAPTNPNPTSTNDVVGYFPGGGHNGAGNKIVDSCLSNTVRPGHLFAVTSNGNSLVLANVTQNQPPTFVDVGSRDFRLTAGSTCSGMGLSDASRLPYGPGVLPPPTAPSPPTVTGTTPAGGRATVAFTPGFDGGSPITGYTAQCSSTDGGVTKSANGTSSPITVTGLTPTKNYKCRVKARNAVGPGPFSAYGNTVLLPPPTAPSPPTVTGTTPAGGRAKVAFTPGFDGGSPITGYTARCSSTNGGVTKSANGTSSPITVTGLTPTKNYKCRVKARNAVGPGPFSAYGNTVLLP